MGVKQVIFVTVFAETAWLCLLWKAASLSSLPVGSLEIKSISLGSLWKERLIFTENTVELLLRQVDKSWI